MFWVLASHQSNGRGRQGKSWASSEGNFYCSVGLISRVPNHFNSFIPLMAGQALWETLVTFCEKEKIDWTTLFLKWPNDLYGLFGKKICKLGGILCESAGSQKYTLGWGLNLIGIPHVDHAGSILDLLGITLGPEPVLTQLIAHFEKHWILFNDNPEKYRQETIETLVQQSMASLWGRQGLYKGKEPAIAVGLSAEGYLKLQFLNGTLGQAHSGEFILSI